VTNIEGFGCAQHASPSSSKLALRTKNLKGMPRTGLTGGDMLHSVEHPPSRWKASQRG